MKKQTIAIVSNDKELRKKSTKAFKYDVSKTCEIDWDVKDYEDRARLGNLPESLIYTATSLNPGSNQHQVAKKLRDSGSKCFRLLLASLEDLIKQHKQYPKASLISNYFAHQKEQASQRVKNIKWKNFREWFKKDSSSVFQDIVIEGDGLSLKEELENKVEEIRRNDLLRAPIKIAIRGLGKQGLGILEQALQNENIYEIHVQTNFVEGNYDELLAPWIDGPDKEDINKILIRHKRAEELIKANPDVMIITAGPHGVDYSAYKDRDELTEFLFKSTAPELNGIIDLGAKRNFKGLWLPQSNPNAHLIKYIRNRGKFPIDQISSIPPDTPRHRAAIYEYLKQINPEIREEDIHIDNFKAIGDHHTTAGIPLYNIATVKGRPLLEVFPELQDPKVQKKLYNAVKDEGLKIMQSSEKYNHDYRGVPKMVAAGLEDITHLRHYPRYPMYAGLMGVPIKLTYQIIDKFDTEVSIRTKKSDNLREIVKDDNIYQKLLQSCKKIQSQTNEWVKQLKNKK